MLFQHIDGFKPRKNKFNISAGNAGTCFLGALVPVYVNELVPGDRVRLNVSSIIRLQPLVSPMLQKLVMKYEAFFVPIRILDDKFKDYYTGGKDGKNDYKLPLINQSVDPDTQEVVYNPVTFTKYSIADYFGLPVGVEFGGDNDPDNESTPIAYPFWAYYKIYTDYYVDENVFSDELLDFETYRTYFYTMSRCYSKDYFTSALPFQQRGIPGAFSWDLSSAIGNAHVEWDKPIPVRSYFTPYPTDLEESSQISRPSVFAYNSSSGTSGKTANFSIDVNVTNPNSPYYSVSGDQVILASVPKNTTSIPAYKYPSGVNPSFANQKEVFPGLNDNKLVTDSQFGSIGFNIADLRYQVQMQKYLERNARAGYRYNEYIFAHFGQHTPDKTIDRAQFIGSAKTEIAISEIPQTSQSTDDVGDVKGSPQGNLAGRGLGTISVNLGSYRAEEPGYIMILQSIVPAISYASQGVSKMFTRRTRFDFYTPEFAHLSEQPIWNRELFFSGDVSKDADVFGYQGIYDDYRFKPSIACADFRDNMSHWKMAREFSDTPELNEAFLGIDSEASYNKAPFAYQGDDYAPFIYDTYCDVLAFRPMPLTAEPGFVDHF